MNLEEARAFVMEHRGEGCTCPTCDQYCQEYERNIYHVLVLEMVALLQLMRTRRNEKWFHIREIRRSPTGGGDFAKLKWWGLVQEKPRTENDGDTRTSGYWRLTPKGIAFLERREGVPETAVIFSNKVLRFQGPTIYVDDCLNKNFSYSELMAGMHNAGADDGEDDDNGEGYERHDDED